MDFSRVKALTIPEGNVRRIDIDGVKVWSALRFNQLVQNGNFAKKGSWSTRNSTYSVENNTALIEKTTGGTGGIIYQTITGLDTAHIYYLTAELMTYNDRVIAALHFGTYSGTIGGNRTVNTYASENFDRLTLITSPAEAGHRLLVRSGASTTTASETKCYAKNVMAIDLTYMYGAGNEPTTADAVEADCAAIGRPLTQYQEYTGLN